MVTFDQLLALKAKREQLTADLASVEAEIKQLLKELQREMAGDGRSTPAARANYSAAARRRNANPKERAAHSARMKAYWARQKANGQTVAQ